MVLKLNSKPSLGPFIHLLNSVNFLKSAHSLIFKMLKNAGKSWKILFTSNHTQGIEFFQHFPEICFKDDPRAFLSCVGFSNPFSWASSLSCLSCPRFAFGFIGWTRVSHGYWANGLSLSCRRRRRLCCSKKESESPGLYLDGRGDGWFFCFSCRATRRRSGTLIEWS